MNISLDIDLTYLQDSMEFLRNYPSCNKNVSQVVDVILSANCDLDLRMVLNRLVNHYGGARWSAIAKLAQAMNAGAVTIDCSGSFRVVCCG